MNLLASYLIDVVEPYAKWITVGIVGALVVLGAILFFAKSKAFKPYVKYAGRGLVVYALAVGIALLILDIVKHYDAAYLDKNYVNNDIIPYVFVPVLVTLCIALFSAVIVFVISKKAPTKVKKATVICGIVCAVSLVTALVLIAIFYSNHIVGDGYYTEGYGELNPVALYVSAGVLVLVGIGAAFFFGRKDKKNFDTRSLAFAGITIALSFTLSYVKLWRMPQGGSVTLVSMLPIMLFSYVYGAKKGILVGLIYGILQSLQDPFIVHPAQFLLDYPVAYALTGLAGCLTYTNLLKKVPQLRFAVGAFVGALFRFCSHVLSGVFAFGAYAKDAGASSALAYSLVYNLVVLIDVALVIVVGIFVFSSKSFTRELGKFNPTEYSEV